MSYISVGDLVIVGENYLGHCPSFLHYRNMRVEETNGALAVTSFTLRYMNPYGSMAKLAAYPHAPEAGLSKIIYHTVPTAWLEKVGEPLQEII